MSRRVLHAVVLTAALLPTPWCVAAPLSIDQAVDLAAQRSHLARSARAGAASAAEMARAAGQLPDPMLTVGIDNLPVTGQERLRTNAEDMTMKRIGLSQEWVSADKRAAREAVAQAMTRREALMEGIAAADARLQAAMAYVDAFYADETLKLTALTERQAREQLETGKGRLATPTGSSADVLALAGAVGLAEDDSEEARQQREVAGAALERWTGLAADELLPPPLAAFPSMETYVQTHPSVAERQQAVEVARQEVEVARLNRTPNWTYELAYGQRQGRADLVSVGVSIPLPVAPQARQDRETAARLALVEKAEAEADEARRAAVGEYLSMTAEANRLQTRIDRYRAAVLRPAEQRSASALAAYRSNQTELVMLFDARRAELEAQRRLLVLQRDLARVVVQLAFKSLSQGAAQ